MPKTRFLSVAALLPLVLFSTLAMPVQAASNVWTPIISIVWPHDASGKLADVSSANLLNVSVWPQGQVSCSTLPSTPFSLYLGQNNDTVLALVSNNSSTSTSSGSSSGSTTVISNGSTSVAGVQAPGTGNPISSAFAKLFMRRYTEGGGSAIARFPSIEFNNIPVDLSSDSSAKFRLVAMAGGVPVSNVWIHSEDPRTIYPNQIQPTGFSMSTPGQVAMQLQAVFPHDDNGVPADVGVATQVNLTMDAFQQGTTLSLPLDAQFSPQLYYSVDNGPMQPGPIGGMITNRINGVDYPRWEINNFKIQPGRTYNFMVGVADNVAGGYVPGSFSNIWTHSANAQTNMPYPVNPPACAIP